MVVLLRTWLPDTAARTMPGLVALAFAISQLDAVVDWPATLERAQTASLAVRSGAVAGLTTIGAVSAGPILRPVLYGPGSAYVWRLPLSDARLAGVALVPAWIAVLPVTIVGALLGPIPALSIGLCTALIALGVLARTPWALVPLGLAALCTGPWAVLPAIGSLAVLPGILPGIGRALRRARPLRPARASFAWGLPDLVRRHARPFVPVLALVQNDVRGLLRTHGVRPMAMAGALFLVSGFIQHALHRSFDAPSIETGGRLLLAASGMGCGILLGELARIHGVRQLDRRHPVSSAERVAALLITAFLPLAPVLAGVLAGGIATGPAGTGRLLLLAAVLASAAVHASIRQPDQARREALASHGITAAVASTVVFGIGPIPAALGTFQHLLAVLLVLVFLFDTHRRLERR